MFRSLLSRHLSHLVIPIFSSSVIDNPKFRLLFTYQAHADLLGICNYPSHQPFLGTDTYHKTHLIELKLLISLSRFPTHCILGRSLLRKLIWTLLLICPELYTATHHTIAPAQWKQPPTAREQSYPIQPCCEHQNPSSVYLPFYHI